MKNRNYYKVIKTLDDMILEEQAAIEIGKESLVTAKNIETIETIQHDIRSHRIALITLEKVLEKVLTYEHL